MANTRVLKEVVEPFVQLHLAKEFGSPFDARSVPLKSGGTHEFAAVSADGHVVACVRNSSGKTSGGKNPSGKIRSTEAALYYLTLVEARTRILLLTDREFYGIVTATLTQQGRVASGIEIRLLELPENIRRQIDDMRKIASREVSPG
jgi:hypothetical protein